MASFSKFNQFIEDLVKNKHTFASHTVKAMLTNTAPVATNAIKADITEISAGNGYTAGGNACTYTSDAQTSGTYKLVLVDPTTWTASGGSIGPFRYVVLYNDTQSTPAKPLIGWFDYGSAVTLAVGETFTADLDQTNGVFTIA